MERKRISPFAAEIISSGSASVRKFQPAVIIKKRKTDGPPELKDLNEDCLIDIFSYLSEKDLVNIVEYDKDNFVNAARIVFHKEFGKQLIKITDEFDPLTEKDPWDVKLLTHFGDLIGNLQINYYCEESRRCERLDEAVLAKCSHSLVKLKIKNGYQNTLSKISEPFVNVRELEFVGGTACDLVSDLNKWFPNASSLEMFGLQTNDSTKYKSFIKHYPLLEHFGVANSSDYGRIIDGIIDNSHLEKFARLNPQLKSLTMHENCYPSPCRSPKGLYLNDAFLANINEALPNLEKLNLQLWHNYACKIDRERLRFKTLKMLTIVSDEANLYFVLPIQTDDLLVLDISANEEVCARIMPWSSTAKKLNLMAKSVVNWCKMNLLKKVVMLPDLNEILFNSPNDVEPLTAITWLIENCFKLSKITVRLDGPEYCEKLLAQFATLKFNEWNAYHKIEEHFDCCFEKKIE